MKFIFVYIDRNGVQMREVVGIVIGFCAGMFLIALLSKLIPPKK